MSKYTTEVRFICEHYSGLSDSKGYANVNEIIENSRGKIFDFPYPIYDENYRSVLETKILKHFYTREIGSETVGLWKLWLDTRMNEIMPYYNQRYNSTLLKFNPLFDTDITTDRNVKTDGSKDDTGRTTETNTNNKVITDDTNRSINETENDNTSTHETENDNTSTHETDTTNNTINGTTTKTTTDDTTVTDNGSNSSTNSGSTETSASETNEAWKYYSDTPQGGIEGLTTLNYLTNATHDTATKSGTDNTSTNGSANGSYNNTTVTDKNVSESSTDKTTEIGTTSKENTIEGIKTNETTKEGIKTNEATERSTREITETDTANNNGTSAMNSVFTNTEDYIEHIIGKRSGISYSKLLEEFRETFLNIDMEIIHELDDLFMNLW